jgi:hypothetical protein
MLMQVDVVQGDGTDTVVLSLPVLGATPKSSLLVQKITGLNPPDITLFIGDYARDGGTYQGRRVGNRNPVLTLTLNPNPALGETISSLRETLYKAFVDPLVDADFIKLNLIDDLGRVRYLVGYTEKFETEIFDVETAAQISVICPDPYIRDNDVTVLSNEPGWTLVPFTYEGTAETGFEAYIEIATETNYLTLENNGKKMVLTAPSGQPYQPGDVFYINTNRGSRAVTRTPSGGVAASAVAQLDPTSPWLELHSQNNTMKVYGDVPTSVVASITTLVYTNAYWGI